MRPNFYKKVKTVTQGDFVVVSERKVIYTSCSFGIARIICHRIAGSNCFQMAKHCILYTIEFFSIFPNINATFLQVCLVIQTYNSSVHGPESLKIWPLRMFLCYLFLFCATSSAVSILNARKKLDLKKASRTEKKYKKKSVYIFFCERTRKCPIFFFKIAYRDINVASLKKIWLGVRRCQKENLNNKSTFFRICKT